MHVELFFFPQCCLQHLGYKIHLHTLKVSNLLKSQTQTHGLSTTSYYNILVTAKRNPILNNSHPVPIHHSGLPQHLISYL